MVGAVVLMLDEVVGDQLVRDLQPPGGEAVVDQPADDGLGVGLVCRMHAFSISSESCCIELSDTLSKCRSPSSGAAPTTPRGAGRRRSRRASGSSRRPASA